DLPNSRSNREGEIGVLPGGDPPVVADVEHASQGVVGINNTVAQVLDFPFDVAGGDSSGAAAGAAGFEDPPLSVARLGVELTVDGLSAVVDLANVAVHSHICS